MAVRPGNGGAGGGERDPRLDALYRDTSRDLPPAHLDAAILAAARREVGSRPRASPLRRWRVPVSIAAIVVLSVSLVTLIREEGGDSLMRDYRVPVALPERQKAEPPQQPAEVAKGPESGERFAAAPEARKRAAPAPEELTLRRDEAEAVRGMAAAEARRAMERQPEPSISKPAPRAEAAAGAAPPLAVGGIAAQVAQDSRARAEADAALKSSTATIGIRGLSEEAERPAPASQAKPLAGPPAAAPSAPKPLADRPRVEERARPIEKKRALAWRGLEQEPPQKWLERLAELRKQGQTREADELLAEFKRRFPAHPLPVGTE